MKRRTDKSAKVSTARAKSPVNSKAEVREGAFKRTSILVDICASPFALKRRSNPSAAFAEMVHSFFAATREDDNVARAFASFQKHFKGVVLGQEDAIRLNALKKRGADKLRIKVGSWPSSIGPGLAYMYDAGLETLRSSDKPIEPELIRARAIRIVEGSLDSVLALIGSMSVTALGLALNDDGFHDHLRIRASQLGTAYLYNPPGPCDYCIFEEKDEFGNVVNLYCGTKQECDTAGAIFIILLILALLDALWDWLT